MKIIGKAIFVPVLATAASNTNCWSWSICYVLQINGYGWCVCTAKSRRQQTTIAVIAVKRRNHIIVTFRAVSCSYQPTARTTAEQALFSNPTGGRASVRLNAS
jgi:hypothetical protein